MLRAVERKYLKCIAGAAPVLSAERGAGEAGVRGAGVDGDRPPALLAPAPPFSAAATRSRSSSSSLLPTRGTRSIGILPRCNGEKTTHEEFSILSMII